MANPLHASTLSHCIASSCIAYVAVSVAAQLLHITILDSLHARIISPLEFKAKLTSRYKSMLLLYLRRIVSLIIIKIDESLLRK